ILPKLHRLAVPCFKALTCPSLLQPVHQAKPCLDLLHFGHITPCHVSYAMSSSITLYKHSSTLSHFSSMAHVAHTSVFVWTNLLCISTQTLISPPKLSLNYQNQTRAFQLRPLLLLPPVPFHG